jgi:para-aminobenzoate synthetase
VNDGWPRELAGGHDRVFWLDGGGSRPWSGTRSVLGRLAPDDVSLTYDAAARRVLRHRSGTAEVVGDDPFTVLAAEVARDAGDPDVVWVGWFGYASRPDLPALTAPSGVPDAVWMRATSSSVVRHPETSEPAPRAPGPARTPPADYAAAFEEVQRQLRRGNSYEVNLTYRESVRSPVDPVTAYLALRSASPAPYAGYLRHHGAHLLSSSPERFATVDAAGWLETRPIKGTTPRGAGGAAEDALLRERLAEDPKYRAENLMIVDLLRNDLSMVCLPGTVGVPDLMRVESYPAVHQLVSTVRGRLTPGTGTVEALRALFPAGSMTGAPKQRTMSIIADVESSARGVYAGAFGWIAPDGRADLGVVIRSLVGREDGDAGGGWCYEMGTGGGITVRSDLAEEYAETRWKVDALRSVVRG